MVQRLPNKSKATSDMYRDIIRI